MRLRLFLICILILQSIISIGQGINCGSYAKISNLNNGFRAGNIDVSGNQLTVEAVIHSQGPNVGTNSVISQDIVSKHQSASDANYLLRINHAEITTTNGFYATELICVPTVNQTFHIAMVYDGALAKILQKRSIDVSKSL